MFIKRSGILLSCLISSSVIAAPNPATQDWVLVQLARLKAEITQNNTSLTAADWAAVCNAGSSPNNGSGCYGRSDTAAFTKLDNGLRGFSSLANFNTNLASPPSDVFIKAFLAGTNIPIDNNALRVSVTNDMVRCTLYTQKGNGINGDNGLNTEIVQPGGSSRTRDQAPAIATINSQSNVNFYYNNNSNPGTANPPEPIYLICVGINSNNGYTPASIAGPITAD